MFHSSSLALSLSEVSDSDPRLRKAVVLDEGVSSR